MNDSPVKKLDFASAGKENVPQSADVDAPLEKPVAEKPAANEAPKAAPTLKELEATEPLLQENPHRFVLFPIKYHEVSCVSLSRVTRIVLPILVSTSGINAFVSLPI